MYGPQPSGEGFQKRLRSLEQGETFLGRFHDALPPVDGFDLRQEIDAGDQLRGH